MQRVSSCCRSSYFGVCVPASPPPHSGLGVGGTSWYQWSCNLFMTWQLALSWLYAKLWQLLDIISGDKAQQNINQKVQLGRIYKSGNWTAHGLKANQAIQFWAYQLFQTIVEIHSMIKDSIFPSPKPTKIYLLKCTQNSEKRDFRQYSLITPKKSI